MPINSINSSYTAREQKFRRLAKKRDLRLVKSRKKYPYDGYMIVDVYFNRIDYGGLLSLDDVEEYFLQS
ncbi:MAG: hypothetical protein PHE79_01840 [Eubacteriales bacterium]|nr:hypothetical protein [Eubacteriales bacterium]